MIRAGGKRPGWAIVVVLALSGSALGDGGDAARAEAKRLKDLGAEALERAEYQLALDLFESAYRAFPSPRLCYNLGLALGKLGRDRDAISAFIKFLDEAADAPPETRAFAEAQVAELGRRLGKLTVATDLGAEIWLDGWPIGSAPLERPVWLLPGAHALCLVGRDHLPRVVAFTVAAGEVRVADARLAPIAAASSLGAAGVAEIAALAALEQFLSAERSLPAPARAFVASQIVELDQRVARLVLAGAHDGAELFVDGARVGRAPLGAPLRLPPGAHDLTVVSDRAPTFHARVTLVAGETQRTVVPEPAVHRLPRVVPPLVAGVALVCLGVGAALLTSAHLDYTRLLNSCSPDCGRDAWSDGPPRVSAGWTLVGLGAALALTDVVLWIFDRQPRAEPKTPPAPSGGGVATGLRF